MHRARRRSPRVRQGVATGQQTVFIAPARWMAYGWRHRGVIVLYRCRRYTRTSSASIGGTPGSDRCAAAGSLVVKRATSSANPYSDESNHSSIPLACFSAWQRSNNVVFIPARLHPLLAALFDILIISLQADIVFKSALLSE